MSDLGRQPETVAPTRLLETKLFVSRSPRAIVPRSRLSERLDRGAASRLMLVSAPAGFGKTTLLAEWLATGAGATTDERSAAWLSLDRGDNHAATFWTYLVAALRTVAAGVGADALALLTAQQPPPIEAVLTTLVNDIGAVQHDIVLVLDDYHVIDSREVQQGMAFLVDHLPPQLHLVIVSRADPALPLARLRARGELVEVRVAELRFTAEEAAAYLNGVMGLALTAPDMAVLEARTEGWIAALQLAALSMQGREDAAGFIAGFAGDDRYVVDYLVEEVLQRQPDEVQTFLLQTSILGRLSGPLCDAITGQSGGKAMLEALDRGNLFLVALDDRRQWYRYHHLFADVLQARLLDELPDQVPELHRRASAWYEQNGERAVAIEHALAAKDFESAADLIELAIPAIRRDLQISRAHKWLQALPESLLRNRPVLSVAFGGTFLAAGQLDEVEQRLRAAERWLDPTVGRPEEAHTPATAMVVVDEQELRRLPTLIAVYRAARALSVGDAEETMAYARRALDLVVDGDHLGRGAAAGLLGLAAWTVGDLATAHESYADCMVSLQRAGHVFDVFVCAITMADIRIAQGRLRDAMRAYEQALQLAPEHGGSLLPGTADMYAGMSALHREYDDLAAARQDLQRSQELAEHTGLPVNRHRWWVAMAQILQAEGDLDDALVHLDEAERLYVREFAPNVRPVPALKARLWITQGKLDAALGWVREQDLSVNDELSYLREFEHITLARVLLAQNRIADDQHSMDEATALLGRLLNGAESGDRTGSVIEILVLQALAHQQRGDDQAALAPLQRAVALAEPQGYVRLVVDEGLPMKALLKAAAEHDPTSSYARRLLSAFGESHGTTTARQGLVDPLSDRELDVLRLLGTELGGPEIARELVVSLNTVRTHTKNIYAKLGVNNRRAAVRRAAELDLLRSRRSDRPSTR